MERTLYIAMILLAKCFLTHFRHMQRIENKLDMHLSARELEDKLVELTEIIESLESKI